MKKKATSIKDSGYSEQVVVFLDVLGFSDATKKSAKDTKTYIKINRLMEEFKEIIATRTKNLNVSIHSFSDSIFLSCPTISEKSFQVVCWIICEFCMKTISCGFFIRGAVTIGPCQEKAEIMFGPACVSAYEIEKFLARWPRCIIDRDLLNRSDIYPNNSWRNRNKYILIGDDGLPYLDYLGYAYINFLGRSLRKSPNEALKVPEVIFLTLRAHKKAIIQSVQEAVKNIEIRNILLSKYYPLAVYHNQVIQRLIPKYDDPGYIKEMSEDYKEMTGELIREDEIQFLLPLLKKDGEKWQVSLEEQSIDIEALFG